ncbi:MAG: XdhC family protein [Pseudomonadota bacterium]
MRFVENVLTEICAAAARGERAALVTLIGIEGSSPRPLGSQIAVMEDGHHVGMITGGCAEKAIASEAVARLKSGENGIVRYGAGSPFLDVVLPCGSGIDLFFEARDAVHIAEGATELNLAREPARMVINRDMLTSRLLASQEKPQADEFVKQIDPAFRLFLFGEGPNLVACALMAQTAGYEVFAFSPDKETLAVLKDEGVETQTIHREADFSALPFDRYSGVVTLFHEHEWEAGILRAALNSEADYIGALGSRRTHAERLEALRKGPETRRNGDIIRGPVGVDIGAANPNEIAVSILAELTALRRRGRA